MTDMARMDYQTEVRQTLTLEDSTQALGSSTSGTQRRSSETSLGVGTRSQISLVVVSMYGNLLVPTRICAGK